MEKFRCVARSARRKRASRDENLSVREGVIALDAPTRPAKEESFRHHADRKAAASASAASRSAPSSKKIR